MTDYVIGADDQGVYEVQIDAGEIATFHAGSDSSTLSTRLQVMVHTGTTPVYVRRGTTVAVADPKATMIPPSTWGDIALGPRSNATIALVSADTATVSVYRS